MSLLSHACAYVYIMTFLFHKDGCTCGSGRCEHRQTGCVVCKEKLYRKR